MDRQKYTEFFDEDFFIKHKITALPEKTHFHIHSQLEIIFTLCDTMKLRLENKSCSIPANCFVLINNSDFHHLYMERAGICDRFVLYFSPCYISSFYSVNTNLLECFYYRDFDNPYVLPVKDEELDTCLTLLNSIEHYHAQNPSSVYGCELYEKSQFCQLLLLINRTYREYHHIKDHDFENYSLFYELTRYIHQNYMTEIRTDQMARQFAVNRTQLYKIFNEISGVTPNEYIINYRISQAKNLLLQNYSVEEACNMCGYNNLSHFSRIFKQKVGMSPKKYQLNSQQSTL